MEFTLNGTTVARRPGRDTTLLELLRDELGVRSVKDGCAPEGSCGACTVMVDGRAVVSCAQKARRFEGKHVVTHEGLSDEQRHLWSECFVGGRRLPVRLLLARDRDEGRGAAAQEPRAERDEIAHALLGNLCRCTGYVKVIDAIELAAAPRSAASRCPSPTAAAASAPARPATAAPSSRSATTSSWAT